ncbi:SPOR domain-containing protein [Bacteroidales bacterium OttesenSCG-928-A17]|nr:SPOR domain-containing protein [Bacteroidales bacterium OttesenSCG-928-A17]
MKTEFKKKERLLSLDALRGFDMLFIMGLAGWIVALCNLFPSSGVMSWISLQMRHVEWDGLSHHDTIFPLFLFIAGISFPFSIAKQRASGKTEKQILFKVIKRGIVLVLLGIVYNGFFRLDFDHIRYASVLGRIGLAWMFAALLFMHFKSKVLVVISALILIGYWLLLWLIPGGPDTFSFEQNLVGIVDRAILPGRLIYGNHFDPEGLLSTLPAIVTAMLGMFTGQFLRLSNDRITQKEKVTPVDYSGMKKFSVVVGSFLNRTNATSLKERMETQGYKAFLAQNERGMYRVIIATFDNKADAADLRDQVKKRYYPNEFQDSWILEQEN